MSCQQLQFVILILLPMSLFIPSVSAQNTLNPNETLEDQFLWGHKDLRYSPDLYQVNLTAGHWTIVINTPMQLNVKITVANDSQMNNAIAQNGFWTARSADFELSQNATIYILVEEGSVNGDTFGSYDIGVYDDAYFATTTSAEFPRISPIIVIGVFLGAIVFFLTVSYLFVRYQSVKGTL